MGWAPQSLLENQPQEPCVDHCVPAGQPARLHEQAEKPLRARPLHPMRGAAPPPGVEVESGSDGEERRGIEARTMLGHPQVLLWRPEADPDVIRLCGIDLGHERLVLLWSQLS